MTENQTADSATEEARRENIAYNLRRYRRQLSIMREYLLAKIPDDDNAIDAINTLATAELQLAQVCTGYTEDEV